MLPRLSFLSLILYSSATFYEEANPSAKFHRSFSAYIFLLLLPPLLPYPALQSTKSLKEIGLKGDEESLPTAHHRATKRRSAVLEGLWNLVLVRL
jgi:hypothetical protein